MSKSLKAELAHKLEQAFPGQVQMDVTIGGSAPPDHNKKQPRNGDADDRLRLLIERIERLEEEKKGIGDDIKDAYNEAKAYGYDAKIMKTCIRLRKMKPDDLREMIAVLETYANAIGLQGVLPL